MADDRSRRPDFDGAIDSAVRTIMSADPARDFDRRVMQRLERPARRPLFSPVRVAATAAALAIVILLATMGRDDAPSQKTRQTDPVVATRVPPRPPDRARVPTATGHGASREQIVTIKPSGRIRQQATGTIAAASVDDEPPIASVTALTAPSPLEVEDIQQRLMTVPDITLPTIEIGELNVQALRPLDERPEE